MASEQYSPKIRSRAASFSSSYSVHPMGTHSDTSLLIRHDLPPAHGYDAEEFSPTAEIFQSTARNSVDHATGPLSPIQEVQAQPPEPLLPHERVALFKEQQRLREAIESVQVSRAYRFRHGSSSSPSPHTRFRAKDNTIDEEPSTLQRSPGPSVKDLSSSPPAGTPNASYSTPNDTPWRSSYFSGNENKSWASHIEYHRNGAQSALAGSYRNGSNNGQMLSRRPSNYQTDYDLASPDSASAEVDDFVEHVDKTFGDTEPHSIPLAHEGSKRTSFLDRVRSVRSRASYRTSNGSYQGSYQNSSPSTFTSRITSGDWSATQSPITPASATPASTISTRSPNEIVSPYTFAQTAIPPTIPKQVASDVIIPSTNSKSPATPSKKHFLLRATPSILRHRHKRTSSKESDGVTSPVSSPPSNTSSAVTSPVVETPTYPRLMSVAKPTTNAKGKGNISAPVPGSLTSGQILEQNTMSWKERRDEAKKMKQRQELKKKIKMVG